MRPKLHELEKTSIELRRAISRLENLSEVNQKEFSDCGAMRVLEYLREARNAIRDEFKDPDLLEG